MQKDKDTKRTPSACDICKKRKGKCSGSVPCSYCSEHDLRCTYIKETKRRGPHIKRLKVKEEEMDVPLLNIHDYGSTSTSTSICLSSPLHVDNELCIDFERIRLTDSFLEYVSTDSVFSTTREKLLNPSTASQKMMGFTVMALMLRASGILERAEQCLTEARMIAGSVLEESTVDAVVAFMALSVYFPAPDHRHHLYVSIAHNISKRLSRKTKEELRVFLFSLTSMTILDPVLEMTTKRTVLLAQIPHILSLASPKDMVMGLLIKVYCTLLPKFVDIFLAPHTISRFAEITLTPDEAHSLLSELQVIEWIIDQNGHSLGKSKTMLLFSVKVCKVIICWRSGDLKHALEEADYACNLYSLPLLKFALTKDLQYIWVLALFYYFVGEKERANKLYNTLKTTCIGAGLTMLLEFFLPLSSTLRKMFDSPSYEEPSSPPPPVFGKATITLPPSSTSPTFTTPPSPTSPTTPHESTPSVLSKYGFDKYDKTSPPSPTPSATYSNIATLISVGDLPSTHCNIAQTTTSPILNVHSEIDCMRVTSTHMEQALGSSESYEQYSFLEFLELNDIS